MRKSHSSGVIIFLLAAVLFTSCSTTIRAVVERPAELDLNGARSISVLPVQVSESSVFQNVAVIGDIASFFTKLNNATNGSYDVADYLTRGLERGISGSQYLDLINSNAVKSAINAGKKAPCDVYLTGTIYQYENEIKSKMRTVTVNKEKTKVEYFYRKISFSFNYQIVDSASNRIISVKSIDVSAQSSEEADLAYVPNDMSTIRNELDSVVNDIMKQIQPYFETKYISLLKDKTKDPDMKIADEYAKKGMLDASRNLYLNLYETRGYFEAGYNAAIILEAQGEYEQAYEEMRELVMKFGDKRAISALNDIQHEMTSRNVLLEQLSK